MSRSPKSHSPDTPVEHSGTLLETDDEICQALRAGLKSPRAAVPDEPIESAPAIDDERAAIPFRPTVRPPLALLTVYDDGKTDGEQIRIRGPRFIIGRTNGDLRIPLDSRISSRHLELTYQLVGGLHRWVVTDLQSRHGLFVRVSRAALVHQSEILIGNGRYRFDDVQAETHAKVELQQSADIDTHGWNNGGAGCSPPAITELVGSQIGNRIILVNPEYWIGSDPECAICRKNDPFCEPRHVRLYRAPKGWYADHNKSQNGLWLRMPQVQVDSTVQFQIGEQRFRLKVQ